MKPRIFKTPIREGQPISARGTSGGINAMAKGLLELSVDGGEVEWRNGRPLIKIGAGLPDGVLMIQGGQLVSVPVAEFECPEEAE